MEAMTIPSDYVQVATAYSWVSRDDALDRLLQCCQVGTRASRLEQSPASEQERKAAGFPLEGE
jgi:hypothetical protein